MIKTLCLGDTGCLGSQVARRTTYHVGHLQFDITCRQSITTILEKYRPNVVINCVGMVKERVVPETAFITVNALGPWHLRHECERVGTKLLQVSTDCVFAGKLKYPLTYNESHFANPTDVYGRSKLLGEAGHVTVRSSFIGQGKYGLLHWLLTTKTDTLNGYINAMWSGLTAPVLADVLYEISQHMDKYPNLIHVHGECISKFSLLGMLNQRFRLGKFIQPVDKPVINRCLSSNYEQPAEIPMLPDAIGAL